MYSLELIIALATTLFLQKNNKMKKSLLIIITIFTTFSTTGMILSLILLFYYFYMEKQDTKIGKLVHMMLIPIILIIVAIVSVYLFNDKSTSGSYSTRIDDYVACYKVWKENIIFGVGFSNNNAIIPYMSSFRSFNTGLSNSFMVVMALDGIYFMLLYIIPFLTSILYMIKNKESRKIIFPILIMVLFITTMFQYKALIINFLAIGYSLIIKNKKKEKRFYNEK